jgi:hypothetical protein
MEFIENHGIHDKGLISTNSTSTNLFLHIFMSYKFVLIAIAQEENKFCYLHGSWMYFWQATITHTIYYKFDSPWHSKFDGG